MRHVVIEAKYCKGCKLCISVCPERVIGLSEELGFHGYHTAMLTDAEACTGCCFCAHVCPDVAIEVYLMENTKDHDN
ncbi:MAG: 4Fe-4S dicluster domain-containing protein [Anaerolineales bacterium]|nr:4Fe-4S dicluster domain-containing protein [Anaerolineales bacterium]